MRPDFRQATILYGGSFDPPHEGHLHVARAALSACPEFRQLVFVPANHSPGKAHAWASGAQRLAWLRAAAEPLGYGVWDTELTRAGESYTVETLLEATAAGATPATLAWLIGADAYRGFGRWREPERIRALAQLLVVNRPGTPIERNDPRDRVIPIPPHPASSSLLRERLARGEDAADWLPAPLRAAMEHLLPGQNPYVRKKE